MKKANRPPSRLSGRIARFGVAAATGLLVIAGAACTAPASVSPQGHINAIFGAHAGAATKVAQCESHLNPTAVSPTGDHGVFQINAKAHRANFSRVTGQPWAAVYNPYWNTIYAKHLFDSAGWGPWTCARKVL